MSREPDEALEVLRGIWSAQGQTSADLNEAGTGKSCKRMADVGFGELDNGDTDVRAAAAWISQWLIGARCAAGQELQSSGDNWPRGCADEPRAG